MRIVLADDQKKVRFALRVLLEQQPGMAVVGEAADDQALLDCIETTSPDVVLVDWRLPGLTGGQLLASLHGLDPELAVVVLSPRLEARRAALDAGASAFVCKCDAPERLLAAIAGLNLTLACSDQTGAPGIS
jgi:DNA-binding NarL/FixJ family response regulator